MKDLNNLEEWEFQLVIMTLEGERNSLQRRGNHIDKEESDILQVIIDKLKTT